MFYPVYKYIQHRAGYLWSCDNFHIVYQSSEGGWHLVDYAVKQKLLSTMKQEPSSHYQDRAVHLTFGFIGRCQQKYC